MSAFVQVNTTASSNTATPACAFTTAPTSGNTLIVLAAYGAGTGTINSCADTLLNSYAPLGAQIQIGGKTIRGFIAACPTGGANTATVTLSASQTSPRVNVYEFSGLSTVIDAYSITGGNAGSSTAITGGPVTTNFMNDLIMGWCRANTAITANEAGWTGEATDHSSEFLISTVNGVYTATWTQSSSATSAAFTVAIKDASPIAIPPGIALGDPWGKGLWF